jgi:hypothetical protein
MEEYLIAVTVASATERCKRERSLYRVPREARLCDVIDDVIDVAKNRCEILGNLVCVNIEVFAEDPRHLACSSLELFATVDVTDGGL